MLLSLWDLFTLNDDLMNLQKAFRRKVNGKWVWKMWTSELISHFPVVKSIKNIFCDGMSIFATLTTIHIMTRYLLLNLQDQRD